MRKLVIAILIVPVLIIGILYLTAPGEMARIIVPVSVFTVALISFFILFIYLADKRAEKFTEKWDESFRHTLAGFELQYERFLRHLYAYGRLGDKYISFKYSLVTSTDWSPPVPGLANLAILCRIKVPRTEKCRLHLAVFPDDRSPAVRSLLGWIHPEPGFYVSKMRNQSEVEAMSFYNQLSFDTKARLVAVTQKYRSSCGTSTDWETVMIGRENALRLVDGNEEALSMLDFQAKIPFNTGSAELNGYLNLLFETVDFLSRDLFR